MGVAGDGRAFENIGVKKNVNMLRMSYHVAEKCFDNFGWKKKAKLFAVTNYNKTPAIASPSCADG